MTNIDYDDKTKTMTITFKDGKQYEYYGVEQGVYDNAISSPSPGRFFEDSIRGVFEYRRLT